jgi:threonine synthase
VANGFLNVEGIQVVLLYPSGKVSPLQEQQLTTLGGNITALEVEGVFDDCQRMVKSIFVDKDVINRLPLSSANSINIARLIPQSFYYLHAAAEIQRRCGNPDRPLLFSVPSGNFGNLTAGLFAKRYGLDVARFAASCNANNTLVQYLQSGDFKPKASVPTISNAMDVGNPSNFSRMSELYEGSREKMAEDIFAASFSDEDTKASIKEAFQKFGYVLDPHTAVGFLGLEELRKQEPDSFGVVLGTAHPAKFVDVVQSMLPEPVEMPPALKEVLTKSKQSIRISSDSAELKEILLNR